MFIHAPDLHRRHAPERQLRQPLVERKKLDRTGFQAGAGLPACQLTDEEKLVDRIRVACGRTLVPVVPYRSKLYGPA